MLCFANDNRGHLLHPTFLRDLAFILSIYHSLYPFKYFALGLQRWAFGRVMVILKVGLGEPVSSCLMERNAPKPVQQSVQKEKHGTVRQEHQFGKAGERNAT